MPYVKFLLVGELGVALFTLFLFGVISHLSYDYA